MPSNDYNRPAGGPAPAALPPTFINPYQFVPLKDGPVRDRMRREYTGSLSGKIHCSLTIKTPLAIPDASREEKDENEHKTYPFLHLYHDDKEPPMIPGSELRGMVRSVYEAATNSCMGVLDDLTLHARSTQLTQKAGLVRMEGDQWYLYPAKVAVVCTFQTSFPCLPRSYPIVTNKDGVRCVCIPGGEIPQGGRISFDAGGSYVTNSRHFNTGMPVASNLGCGRKEGYLLIGERGLSRSRHNSHIIYDPSNKGIPLQNGIVELEKTLVLYRDETVNKTMEKTDDDGQPAHTGYAGYEISETDYNPVFYREVDRNGEKEYILSLAMQGREVFSRKLADFAGGYAPCTCRDGENICPACAMFGQINQNTSGGFCGRVRFTDAMGDETVEITKAVTLRELSSPKVSSTEFYTFRPGNYDSARIWNYAYRMKTGARNPEAVRLDVNELKLRGRKFYLHSRDVKPVDYTTNVKNERNSTMDIATKGRFAFDVYFDGVSEEELNMLLWCLSPRRHMGERMETLYHKLGHGRPLGLGSVEVALENVVCRSVTRDESGVFKYTMEPYAIPDELRGAEARVPNELKNVLAFGLKDVHYPIGRNEKDRENADAGYQWFVGNRQLHEGATGTNPIIEYTLPEIPKFLKTVEELQQTLSLPSLIKPEGGRWREVLPVAPPPPPPPPEPAALEKGKTYRASFIEKAMFKGYDNVIVDGAKHCVKVIGRSAPAKGGFNFRVREKREDGLIKHYEIEVC